MTQFIVIFGNIIYGTTKYVTHMQYGTLMFMWKVLSYSIRINPMRVFAERKVYTKQTKRKKNNKRKLIKMEKK